MALTRLDNLISSKTGKYLYVSPDDFNASDELNNRGNSPIRPFKSIQRAFLEIARYSYLPGPDNDRFDQFTIMLMPGNHYIDNRPGLVDTNGIDAFSFNQALNEWEDSSNLDISDPNNKLYLFNNTEGGAILPRGSSLVGYDLRRTVVRPLYVPDPAVTEREIPRSAIFNVTGGCYFWQFTIKDGQTTAESPLYNSLDGTGEVYYDPNDFTKKAPPNYSHHKLTVFEYADTEELSLFYRKIAKGFSLYQPTIDDPGEFDFRVQENRIVGPLSDSRVIESLKLNDATTIPSIPASTSEIEVTTKVDHGYFAGQFVAISNTEVDSVLEGIFPIKRIDENDPRKFTYEVAEVVSAIGTGIASGNTIDTGTTPALGGNAQTLAEVDSVESASPYVFNCSIRSTWGICGIWANGLKATGFKSMVIAQYTGVSLQKDDRAFIRYDEYSNTWNQASLTDAFATVPYHTKGDSYWKDDWRNFHVRASEDAFIQNVSIFAVGFADHFLMESGGDMSITNSNSNFGNTSLHAIGFKGFAFNQDKGGYITDIIPPKKISDDAANVKKTQYYTIDIQGTIADANNYTKLFLGSDDIKDPLNRPAVSINGYRLGAKSGEKLYVKLDPATAGGTEEFNVSLEPTGFVKYIAAASILNPSGFAYNSTYADAANLIESNRKMIQEEVFGYIIEKFPRLQDISYVNPGRDPNANRYNDARNLIISNRQDIVNDTMTSLSIFNPTSTVTAEDVGEMVDAVAEDLRDGGNSNTILLIQSFFNGSGQLSKYAGEQENVLWAINRARDLCKQAVSNLLAVKADLYDPDSNSLIAPYGGLPIGTITAGKTGSQAEIDGDTTNGVTIDPAQKIDPASRFRDTYRLINNNRDYILDNALAEIATYDESPFFYFPGDPQETSQSRFKTAYRLIRRNKAGAIDAAITAIQTAHPAFVFPSGTPDKCRRDLGAFIDSLGMDIFLSGNQWTITFMEKYFEGSNTWVTGGLQGEETEAITGFNAVRDYLQDAVSNQLTSGYQDLSVSPGEAVYGDGNGDLTNTDASACADVQNAIATLTSIVTQVISDGNPDTIRNPNNPNFVNPQARSLQANENKCRRDIGHIVDAVMQDLWFGGNAYSVSMARAYFDRFGNAISNGLIGEQSQAITAFRRAADVINSAINNRLLFWDQSITLDKTGDPPIVSDTNADAHRLIMKNKEWLAEEAYERMLANPLYSSYEPQEQNTKQDCLDDVINILEMIMYDVKFGGNAKTYDSAEIYITNVMPFFGSEKKRKEYTPTNVTYDPATGLSVFTIPGHDMVAGNYVRFDDNSLVFTCAMDNNQSQKSYPRAGQDPFSGNWCQIVDADESSITCNVGVSGPNLSFDPTNVIYNSTSGAMEITIGAGHGLSVGEGVMIANNSLTFTCDQDNNQTQHTYPRAGQDPYAGKSFTITAISTNTITVNVGAAGTAAGVPHTFVSALAGSVTHSPQSAHTFISATDNCIGYGLASSTFIDPERDEAREVFNQVRALVPDVLRNIAVTNTGANTLDQYIDGATVQDWDSPACVNVISAVQSNIDTIMQAIGNDLAGVGNLNGIARTVPAQPVDLIQNGVNQGYVAGNCSDVVAAVNSLIDITVEAVLLGTLDNLPSVDNGLWDCANVRSSIENLFDIAVDAFSLSNLTNLPVVNRGSFTNDAEASKCYRDVAYIVDAVVSDLRLGGNINSVQAGEAYYVGTSSSLTYTPTNATYDPATGQFVLTVPNHSVQAGRYIRLADNSFTFTCGMDNNKTEKSYPRPGIDPYAGQSILVTGVTANTITCNVGVSGPNVEYTPTDASYDPATGDLVLTIGSHSLTVGEGVVIDDNSLTFTCGMDNDQAQKSYPRSGIDPFSGRSMLITSRTSTTITVNAGVSGPNKQFTPTNAQYNPSTGDMVLTVGQHGLGVGRGVVLADNSLTFTCALDNNATQHSYPRPGTDPYAGQKSIEITAVGSTQHTVTNAPYNASTGVITLTVGNHGFSNGDYIKVADGSLTYTCDLDGNLTQKSYPRANYDYPSGRWMEISNVTANTFDINVGPSSYTGTHTFVSAAANGIERQDGTFTINVGVSPDTSAHTFVSATANAVSHTPQSAHTFVSAGTNCVKHLPQVAHTFVRASTNALIAGGSQLQYIDGEKTETLAAWDYVGQMATAAMRNFDFLAYNCTTTAGSAIVDVGDTRGILVGMRCVEYDDTDISNPAYVNGVLQAGAQPVYTTIGQNVFVKRIVNNTQIELGVENSRFEFGQTVNANQSSSTIDLFFVFENGQWADTLPKTVTVGPANTDPDVIADTLTGNIITDPADPNFGEQIRECAGTANAITTLIGNITTIINSGVGSVTRQEQTADISLFSQRSTVFTINTSGLGASNPHNFETGTPVRLVPRPRFDTDLGRYVDVDKRLIRLPDGFETNRTYYVIAPGRKTQPFDFSNTTFFNGSDQTKLMLATSRENAAAGIFIYASESESIDPNVEIDIYQFILDEKYDLHRYKCNLSNAVVGGIETDVSNVFDVPFSSVTPQKVFFRDLAPDDLPTVGQTFASDPEVTVTDVNDANFGRLNPVKEFFARYQTSKVFTIHKTHADAINNADPIQFTAGQTDTFQVFCNKRRSPVKYDPTFNQGVANQGKWYIECIDEGSSGIAQGIKQENIFWRLHQDDYSDRPKTTDTWFTRLEDNREADDRTYKLRYVIPSYLENARDPINGFVIKTRTDDTRKLVPQKVLLKPVAGSVFGARFENPVQAGEYIGYTGPQFTQFALNSEEAYDPYRTDQTGQGVEYKSFARFTSGIQATIQSGRYVEDPLDPNIQYLELTLIDHTVDAKNFPGLKNEQFTTVRINPPQGGEWVVNKTASITANQVEWTGNSSGIANIHAYYENAGSHYLILKNIRGGKLEFSEFYNTRFTQGSTFADMLEDQDMGKSLPLKTLIKKGYPEYYYKQNGANVYTITPGDRIQDSAGVEYYAASVEDAGIIDDTFYVFNYETLQRRIAGQQDGIYYLSCLRGNISPLPTGAGAGGNFRKFNFSQPVSSLYPLNYKNDPLWFQKAGTTAAELNLAAQQIDPPATFSAADNYIHGLVRTNDYKNSVTRELVEDLTNQPAFIINSYSGVNEIRAQDGNATSGSEDRRIPIAGDSLVVVDQKYYVELRRPSIARAGNHTFEYLGFGPGNYSTGLPARQEIVLTPTEDFYAQSKKQDAGIVFYTGLNSNGDLYIGNRKINAITGEETFLEAAVLQDSDDDDEDIGNLVTSFDTPVTFNQNITVVGGDGSQQNVFQSPVVISVQDNDLTETRDSLIIRSNVSSVDPVTNVQQDESLDRTAWSSPGNPVDGDIRISKNRINAAVFGFNPRGKGQAYQIQTHISSGIPSNITPNNSPLVADGGTRLQTNQFVDYNGVQAGSGDILLKGVEVGKTGSLGWVYANYFTVIPSNNIFTIEFDGTNVVKLTFKDNLGVDIPNSTLGINSGSSIKLTGYINPLLNSTWLVYSPNGDAFDPANNYVHFQVNNNIGIDTLSWNGAGGVLDSVGVGQPTPKVEFSNANWKEYGVVGAEALRTETENIGDYKLGVNTIARTDHVASGMAFTSIDQEPRANLDVVGTAFISGKTIESYLTESTILKTETDQDNAFLVGGDSSDPDDSSVLRVMTTNNGRVGINTKVTDSVNPQLELDRNFVVVGNSRFTGDSMFMTDIEVNGGDITTTNNAFNFVNQNANILNWASDGQIFNLMNSSTVPQTFTIGGSAPTSTWLIAETAATNTLYFGRNSTKFNADIGTVAESNTSECDIRLGGGFATSSPGKSRLTVGTFYAGFSGQIEFGSGYGAGTSSSRIFSQTRVVNAFDGTSTNTVNLATNATTFTMGSTGGTTVIRNSLNVLASAIVEGNIRLDGGLNAGIVKIGRGKFGTTPAPHLVGGVENPNIDFYKYEPTGRRIDTAGVAPWGSTQFLVAGGQIASIDNITNNGSTQRQPGTYQYLDATTSGSGTGAAFSVLIRFDFTIEITIESGGEGYADNDTLTITDSQLGGGGGGDLTFLVNGVNSAGANYYLPITTPSPTDFQLGDLLLIDREVGPVTSAGVPVAGYTPDESKSEIVQVIGIDNITNANDPQGYRLIVTRGIDGTTSGTDHPDNCVIAKLDKQSNASYITGSDLDANGELDEPLTGIGAGTADVNIGVAEFGGTISTQDFFRLSASEFCSIEELISTSPQSLIINDGGDPAAEVFKVESTTGDTYIFGDIAAGSGFNKFTVDSNSGNTNIAGTLTTENTLTINGSTLLQTEFFRITNGGATGTPLRTTLEVDTATGDLTINGGNINVFGTDGTTPRLTFVNSSGDFTVYGSFSALGTGTSTFGGDIDVAGDAFIRGGDLTVYAGETTAYANVGDEIFGVDNNGSVKIAGISNYFSQTGARKWLYQADSAFTAESNVNYFVNCTGNTLIRLPASPEMGDQIRIIDISGSLSYNQSMVVRAPDNAKVQGEVSNTGSTVLQGIPPSAYAGYNGGELVVQTPNAAFTLVYAGNSTPDGLPGAPSSLIGWYLTDV